MIEILLEQSKLGDWVIDKAPEPIEDNLVVSYDTIREAINDLIWASNNQPITLKLRVPEDESGDKVWMFFIKPLQFKNVRVVAVRSIPMPEPVPLDQLKLL